MRKNGRRSWIKMLASKPNIIFDFLGLIFLENMRVAVGIMFLVV